VASRGITDLQSVSKLPRIALAELAIHAPHDEIVDWIRSRVRPLRSD
jgi:hypothetical protein